MLTTRRTLRRCCWAASLFSWVVEFVHWCYRSLLCLLRSQWIRRTLWVSKIPYDGKYNCRFTISFHFHRIIQLRRHRPLKSARVRCVKAAAKEQWHKKWNEDTKTAKTLRHIMKTNRKGNKTGPNLYNEMISRNTAAIIAQLRTGHCGLNHYLHRFDWY